MFKGTDSRPFENKIWLASPTMHGEELKYMQEAYDTNWMSTVGANINEVERIAAEKAGVKYAVALSSCTAALHLCVKLAGERMYGRPVVGHGAVEGIRVFCSDMTFDATLNPVLYEGGIPVFIDTNPDTWNMDPAALEKAFEMYPEVKLVVCAELYGFPTGIKEIKAICEKHGALLIEDAAEAMGAFVDGQPCGSFGDYSAISYNGNKIITGSSGGCLLSNSLENANKARKWSTMFDLLEGKEDHCEFDGVETVPDDNGRYCYVPVTHKVTLGEIVDLLQQFKEQPNTLMMPKMPAGSFAKKLYSLYLTYLPVDKFKYALKMNCDDRGSFTELVHTEDCGQVSINISRPGITKDNDIMYLSFFSGKMKSIKTRGWKMKMVPSAAASVYFLKKTVLKDS